MVYVANPLPGYKCLVQLAGTSTPGTNLVLNDLGDHQTFNIPLADIHRYIDRNTLVTVQTSIDGGTTWSGTLAASAYTLRYLTAQVLLAAPLSGGTTYKARLAAYNYLPYAAIVYATDITSTINSPMLDITAFQGAAGLGMISVIPGALTSGHFACKAWQVTPGSWVYLQHMLNDDLLILSFVDPNGVNAFEAYCRIATSTLISSLTTVAEEDLTFTIDAQPVLI